ISLFFSSQFWPNPLPVVRAQITACDRTVGGTLDVGAAFKGHWSTAGRPIAHIRNRRADSACQCRQAAPLLSQVIGQFHAPNLAKRETLVNSVTRISVFRVLLSNSAHERH